LRKGTLRATFVLHFVVSNVGSMAQFSRFTVPNWRKLRSFSASSWNLHKNTVKLHQSFTDIP